MTPNPAQASDLGRMPQCLPQTARKSAAANFAMRLFRVPF